MKKIILIIILVIIFISFSGVILKQKNKNILTTEVAVPTQSQAKSFNPKEDTQGEVTVKVIPLKLSSGENVEFNISLSTHSVELDKSLKDVSLLEDDEGNISAPINWSGGSGGHHIEGNLVFPSFPDKTKSVKLIIKQIGGVERVFKWTL